MLISIIIPVYNAAKTIERAISSVISQLSDDCEIILVDDGSMDNSPEICDRYSDLYINITTLHCNNTGPSGARNTGILAAKGNYVAFLDADDALEGNWLAVNKFRVSKDNFDLLVFGYTRVEGNLQNTIIQFEPKANDDTICGEKDIAMAAQLLYDKYLFNIVWNKLYKRELLTKYGIMFSDQLKMGEDFYFNIKVFSVINTVCFVNEVLYRYYITKGSLSNTIAKEIFWTGLEHSKVIAEYVNKCGIKANTNYRILYDYLFSSVTQILFSKSNRSWSDKKHELKTFLNNDSVNEVIQNSIPQDIKSRAYHALLKTRCPFLINFCFSLINSM